MWSRDEKKKVSRRLWFISRRYFPQVSVFLNSRFLRVLAVGVIRFPSESVGSKSGYSHQQNSLQGTIIISARCITLIVSEYYCNVYTKSDRVVRQSLNNNTSNIIVYSKASWILLITCYKNIEKIISLII